MTDWPRYRHTPRPMHASHGAQLILEPAPMAATYCAAILHIPGTRVHCSKRKVTLKL